MAATVGQGGPALLSLNIMHFARLLRRAGLPVGPSAMLAAQQAMTLVEIGSSSKSSVVIPLPIDLIQLLLPQHVNHSESQAQEFEAGT